MTSKLFLNFTDCGLSTHMPQGFVNAIFYCNELNLTLRGGDEHKGLKLSQIAIKAVEDSDDPSKEVDCLIYVGHVSVNRRGNCKQVNLVFLKTRLS